MNIDREPEAWQECPPGELKQMVGRIRLERRRDFVRTLAKGTAAVVVLGAGGLVASQWMHTPTHGKLACSKVTELMPDYKARRLDSDLMERVATHLANCSKCNAHYQEMVG